jgi:hypothetical protein
MFTELFVRGSDKEVFVVVQVVAFGTVTGKNLVVKQIGRWNL